MLYGISAHHCGIGSQINFDITAVGHVAMLQRISITVFFTWKGWDYMVEGVLLSVGLFFRFLFQSFKWFSRPELKSEKSIFFKGAVNVVRHFELEASLDEH